MPKNILRGDGTERLLVRPTRTMRRPPLPHSGEAFGICPILDSSGARWRCDGPTSSPDFECADWDSPPAGYTVLTDDEDADFKPNCIYPAMVDNQVGNGVIGSHLVGSTQVPTAATIPNLGTNDFTIEVWICELTPPGFANYAAWTVALNYIDPPFNALDDIGGFQRVTPRTHMGFDGVLQRELTFGLCHHGTDMYLWFHEDELAFGIQSFQGAAVPRPRQGAWTHYALVCERSNNVCYLYMDGVRVTTLNIVGHRAYNVTTSPETYRMGHHPLSNYLNPPDRGVATTVAAFPQFKLNLHTFHYEALTAAEVMQSYIGKTTQNKATTYARYDWRNAKKGSYQCKESWIRWRNYLYQPYAAGLPAGFTADSFLDTSIGSRGGAGFKGMWACREVRDLFLHNIGTCCDTSLWGVGQGHAELIQRTHHWFDQDPFWET